MTGKYYKNFLMTREGVKYTIEFKDKKGVGETQERK